MILLKKKKKIPNNANLNNYFQNNIIFVAFALHYLMVFH